MNLNVILLSVILAVTGVAGNGEISTEVKDGVIDELENNQGIATEQTQSEIIEEIPEFNGRGIVLKEGKACEEVIRLKRFLIVKGYELKEDYLFDGATKKAVMDYQRKNSLEVDGSVGPKTIAKINEDMKKNGIVVENLVLDITKEVPKKDWIIINKSNNTLYHLKGRELINKYSVATGKEKELTPEGKFNIVNKLTNPAWGGAGRHKPIKGGDPSNPLGKRWMGLSIGGGGNYGIHGNSAPSSIGTYASLGCVRMNNADVEYLFNIIPKGTQVWIGSEGKLKEYGIEIVKEK